MAPVLLFPDQAKATFASLPHDVLAIILRHSPDLDTFLSSIASCRAFFNAFKNAPTSLTKSLVDREVGDLLPQATFVVLARDARPHAHSPAEMAQAISQLLSRWADESVVLTHRWSLAEGIAAIRLDRIIGDLARRSAAFCLSWLEKLSGHSQESPSDSELARIKRALYRFELNCRLLPPVLDEEAADPVLEAGQLVFLQQGHPWENEQLASVHESLWRLVAPAYNEVAIHDIAWGAHGADYARDTSDTATEWLLSRGLRSIHDIARATTYDRRYELIGAGTEKPHHAFVFLSEAFDLQHTLIQEPRPEVVGAAVAGPAGLYEDPNPGPERFWRWAHPHLQHNDPRARLVESRYKPMRDCGYVFWDAKRLDSIGILDQRWADVEPAFKTQEDVFLNRPGHMRMKFSGHFRYQAYKKGIRGYYLLAGGKGA
ncbi:hypothetical protein C8A01DRAFT_40438 [Parachaetomium inaequale]|uniref:Uncharacterized protein n=1 Tax=Parachaetomium inaequale TaxID=2588326 RepID=A0AAN6SLT4_9PEZI|nr:hypothetical protein C8A01DRAFT_40438 [Parachaetomium inaequale]